MIDTDLSEKFQQLWESEQQLKKELDIIQKKKRALLSLAKQSRARGYTFSTFKIIEQSRLDKQSIALLAQEYDCAILSKDLDYRKTAEVLLEKVIAQGDLHKTTQYLKYSTQPVSTRSKKILKKTKRKQVIE